jgi:cytidylate kinase
MGVDLVKLGEIAEKNPRIDLEIDRRALEEARKGGVVVDSHLAGWALAWIADVLVYVKAPVPVRVARVSRRDQVDEAKALDEVLAREFSQWRRFKEFYGFDSTDLSVYHLVVDTSMLGAEEAYRVIKEFVVAALSARGYKLEIQG